MRDTGLANRLRKRGVEVVEVSGWLARGNDDFAPYGSVNHHTAGSPNGAAPSLAICTYGRSDLPGPLCHVLLGRDLKAYVIAAGRANHAGTGGWQGLSGNRRVHGLEIEHVGYGPSPEQVRVAVQIHAAFLEAPGSSGNAGFVCQHFEWAPGRKVDFRDLNPWTPAGFRNDITTALKSGGPTPPPDEDDEMITVIGTKAGDRNWAALMDGYVRIFNIWDPGNLDSQTVWCPNDEYNQGVGVMYKQVKLVDTWAYDNMVASAKRIPDRFIEDRLDTDT